MTIKTLTMNLKCRSCRDNLYDLAMMMDKHHKDNGDAVLVTLTFEDGSQETMSGQKYWCLVKTELADI